MQENRESVVTELIQPKTNKAGVVIGQTEPVGHKSCLFSVNNIGSFPDQVNQGDNPITSAQVERLYHSLQELEEVGYVHGLYFENLPFKPIIQAPTAVLRQLIENKELVTPEGSIHPKAAPYRVYEFTVEGIVYGINNYIALFDSVRYIRADNAVAHGHLDKMQSILINKPRPVVVNGANNTILEDQEKSKALIQKMLDSNAFPKSYTKELWKEGKPYHENVQRLFHDYHRGKKRSAHPKRAHRPEAKALCHLIKEGDHNKTTIMSQLFAHSKHVHSPAEGAKKVKESGSFSHRVHYALAKGLCM